MDLVSWSREFVEETQIFSSDFSSGVEDVQNILLIENSRQNYLKFNKSHVRVESWSGWKCFFFFQILLNRRRGKIMVDPTAEAVACPSTETNGDLKQRNIISNGNGTTHKPSNGHVPSTKVRRIFIVFFSVFFFRWHIAIASAVAWGQCHWIWFQWFQVFPILLILRCYLLAQLINVTVCFCHFAYLACSGHMDVERPELEKCFVFRIFTHFFVVYDLHSTYRASQAVDCVIW